MIGGVADFPILAPEVGVNRIPDILTRSGSAGLFRR
jgi:hypothetical protein